MMEEPMNKSKRQQTRPKAVKMSDEDFERFYSEIYEEFGPKKADKDVDLTADLPVRNAANNYGRPQPKPQNRPANVQANAAEGGRNTYADPRRNTTPAKKDNSIRNLTIAVCLECVGIVAVVLWWVLRIL